MSEAYTVAARLNFTSNAPTIIADLIRSFERLDTVIGSTQGNISRLAAELRTLSTGGRGITRTVEALEKLNQVRLAPGLVAEMQSVARSATEAAAAARSLGRAPIGPRVPPVGPAARPGAPGAPRTPQPQSGSGFSHHDLFTASIGLQMAGDTGLGVFGHALKAEAEIRTQLAALRMNTTVTDGQVEEARALAEKITRLTPGTTTAGNLKTILEAYTALGDLHEAMLGAPAMAQLSYLLENLPGAHQGHSAFAAAQAVEVMQRMYDPRTHSISMDAFNQQLAAMTQVALGTQGRAGPEAYLGFAKQARVGGMVANDTFLYRDLPAMLIALGGNRAGTGEAATFQQFITGRMTANAAARLRDAGILDRTAVWHGGQVRDMQRHLTGYQVFGENPVEWVRQFMLGPQGALARNHIDPSDRLAVAKFLSDWSSRQTGLGFMAEMTLGMQGINKEGGKVGQTTRDPMGVLRRSDPMQQVREFHAAENELFVALGQNALGPALEALKTLTKALHELAEWGKTHPDAARNLTLVGGGLSALATAAGEAALVVYIGAPIIGGLRALAVALNPFGAGGEAAAGLGGAAGGLRSIAAVRGLATLGGTLWSVAGGLGALALAAYAVPRLGQLVAGLLGIQNQTGTNAGRFGHGGVTPPPGASSNHFGDWLHQKWEQFRDAPAPGHSGGTRGHLEHHSSLIGPPVHQDAPVTHVLVQLDGREIAANVTTRIARAGSGPSGGTTGFDPRVSTGSFNFA